jgi:metal-responsive CopG/Arc/MetJ family transcriptional regulator
MSKRGVQLKNVSTIAVSIPKSLKEQVESIAKELNVSRSAVVTMAISKLIKEQTKE